MGIRFYCPNGHKLNVKDFQAGQMGICPFCGIKMQIPSKSVRPSSKEENQGFHCATIDSSAAGGASDRRMPPVGAGGPASPVAGPAGVADPLAEDSELVWYVRPPSGGQFGPAVASVMKTWLAENRISDDSLVWREGWRDWQTAGDVFPQLAGSRPVARPEAARRAMPVAAVAIQPATSSSRSQSNMPLVVGGLILAVVLLLAILIVVLVSL
jgi:hypothetical protein